jgi:hypothetical protein
MLSDLEGSEPGCSEFANFNDCNEKSDSSRRAGPITLSSRTTVAIGQCDCAGDCRKLVRKLPLDSVVIVTRAPARTCCQADPVVDRWEH